MALEQVAGLSRACNWLRRERFRALIRAAFFGSLAYAPALLEQIVFQPGLFVQSRLIVEDS